MKGKHLSLTSALLLVVAGKTANQLDYPACAIRQAQYCCDYGNGIKRLFTKYTRPTGDSAFEDAYVQGWNQARQVNHENFKVSTPNSPTFHYNDPSSICRIHTTLDSNNQLQDDLLCGEANNRSNSMDATIFYDFKGNVNNNNGSCPDFATFYQTNAANRASCVSQVDVVVPLVTTYTEAPLLVVYVLYILFFVGVGLWMVFKKVRGMKRTLQDLEQGFLTAQYSDKDPQRRSSTLAAGGRRSMRKSEERLRMEDSDIQQTGYVEHPIGQALLYVYGILSALLNVLLVLIILDYYVLYGEQLFGRGKIIMAVFMVVWFVAAAWFIVLVCSVKNIRNFFRLQSALQDCTYVDMFKPEHVEILLSDPSGISAFVARVERFFVPKKQSGHNVTVAVVQDPLTANRMIKFQHVWYIYDATLDRFEPGTVTLGRTYSDMQTETGGLTSEQHAERTGQIGQNLIEIQMPTVLQSVADELCTIYYCYLVQSYFVWFYLSYWNLGAVMAIVVTISAFINILTKRQMQTSMISMTKYETEVDVLRDGVWHTDSSVTLVPGDVIKVQENWILPCDLVVIKGSTVCDESMLTGESMPVQKFPIPQVSHVEYDSEGGGKKYTLFAGSEALSSGRCEDILAIVQTTGAHTSKGQLIRNILFPLPMKFKYDEHLKLVMFILAIYCLVAIYLVISFLTDNGDLENELASFTYCVFIVSTIISPLLPVVITVGQVNASKRLKKLGVYCLNSKRITLSGKVRVFCFDKTGTLTKQGLDFLGCKAITKASFADIQPVAQVPEIMRFAVASCHAVGSLNGQLVGNQVELKMFTATGWELLEGEHPMVRGPNGECLAFVKRYEFDHHRMSMSVVMRNVANGELLVFCKGSYEKMKSLSNPHTIPANYVEASNTLARNGCYVLGMGYKTIRDTADLENMLKNRDLIECDLTMLGLIMYRNELKPDSKEAISKLKDGDVRVTMITGDNAMCGCYIARVSGMVSESAQVILADVVTTKDGQVSIQWSDVDTRAVYEVQQVQSMVALGDGDVELAVTGPAFDILSQSKMMESLLLHTRIFSRMTPNGKVDCVKMHMKAGAITGMAGDGGNDAGALRCAHVGIALSDAEASIVSPFTSKPKTISSVVDLCREGRCSLATSFASVKFLIMYGFCGSTMRFFQYYHGVVLSEWAYVLMDGITLVLLSYLITLAKPLPTLGSQRPTSSLLGPVTIASLLGQEVINLVFLVCAIQYLQSQPWYCPFSPDNIDMAKWWLLSDNPISTCLFFMIVFQEQAAAFVFSLGSRYRRPIWHNRPLCLVYLALFALDIYLLLGSQNWLIDLFRIASSTNVVGLPDIPLPFDFRLNYIAFGLGNFFCVWLYELLVVQGPVRDWVRAKFHKDRVSMNL